LCILVLLCNFLAERREIMVKIGRFWVFFVVGIVLWVGLGIPFSASAQVGFLSDNGKVILSFTETIDTGIGRELFVVGNHADVGNWQPVDARKLHWSPGNVWTGQVAVEAGWTLEYRFITRTNDCTNICDAANVIWVSEGNLTTSVPDAVSPPYSTKAMYYYSGWTNAQLVYQSGQDTTWYTTNMTLIGAGRVPNEYLYYVDGFGNPGELLTFIPHGWLNGSDYWDHSPATGGDYYTPLDIIHLQDGNIFNYQPPAVVDSSQIVTTFITSGWAPTIPSRNIRIYLPRNYATNTWKKYPVLYMHDGQNDFQPGEGFGCWNADWTADDMISLGVMRETIIVAVDNSSEREREYVPPNGDCGSGPGTANQYGNS